MTKDSENKKEKKGKFADIFKKGDIIILLLLVVVVIITIVFATRPKTATVAEIYVDGRLAYSLDLSKDADIELLDGRMTISVEDGKVFVKDSDCKEQLCVHSSPISGEGGMIVCLPNKVVVKVATEEVDAIS